VQLRLVTIKVGGTCVLLRAVLACQALGDTSNLEVTSRLNPVENDIGAGKASEGTNTKYGVGPHVENGSGQMILFFSTLYKLRYRQDVAIINWFNSEWYAEASRNE